MKIVTPTEWVVEYQAPYFAKDCLDCGVFTGDEPIHPQHLYMVVKYGDMYFFSLFFHIKIIGRII